MRRLPIACVAIFASLAVGCTAGPDEGEARLELGTGTWRFEPLEDGQELELVRGAQGGWHLWLSVRTAEMSASGLGSLEIVLEPADESAPPQRSTVGVRLDPPDAEGRRAYVGWAAILRDPACAVGKLYRIEATFTDAAGERVRAERYVTPAGGQSPPPECGAS